VGGGDVVGGGPDLGGGRTLVERLPAGATVVLDVAADQRHVVASFVSAHTAHGATLPPTLLPAPRELDAPVTVPPEPAPVTTPPEPAPAYEPLHVDDTPQVPTPSHGPASDDGDGEPVPRPAGDVAAAKGKLDVTRVTSADPARKLTVGDKTTIHALLVNGTDRPAHNVRLVASLPRYVTVRDDNWMPHREGRVKWYATYLPPGHEVTVPLTVRVDKSGELTVAFEVDHGDDEG
jgi:hypothetical protein